MWVKRFWGKVGVVVSVVLIDQASKWLVVSQGWKWVSNTGVAFGLLPSNWWLLVTALVLGWLWRRADSWDWWMVVGGGAANLVDRIMRGAVVDIISWWIMPAFNLADVAIVAGSTWLVVSNFSLRRYNTTNHGRAKSNLPRQSGSSN